LRPFAWFLVLIGASGFSIRFIWGVGIFHSLYLGRRDFPFALSGALGFSIRFIWGVGIFHLLYLGRRDFPFALSGASEFSIHFIFDSACKRNEYLHLKAASA
jgi:hypothetical protein